GRSPGRQATRILVAGDVARSKYHGQQSARRRHDTRRGRGEGGAGADRRTGGEHRVNVFPVILSAPSGGGKTTITHALLARRPDVGYSVSCTTRPPRPHEVNGKDYYFLSTAEFLERQQNGEFAESAAVHGHLYGTLRKEVNR